MRTVSIYLRIFLTTTGSSPLKKERLKNYFRQVFSKAFHYLIACTLEVEAINVVHRTPC